MSSAQEEVEDISNLHGDSQHSVSMADEGVYVPIVVPSIVPPAVPTAVQVLSLMGRDSHVRTQVRWKQLSVDCYGIDGEDADRKVGGDLGCKHGSHALCQGGDQDDHSWVALADDDFRHRRRGRGDDTIDFADQLDEFLEDDSVACAIEDGDGDGDSGSREDNALQQDFERDVQTPLWSVGW